MNHNELNALLLIGGSGLIFSGLIFSGLTLYHNWTKTKHLINKAQIYCGKLLEKASITWKCSLCKSFYTSKLNTPFECNTTTKIRYCCKLCLLDLIYMRQEHNKGTAFLSKCFCGCATTLTIYRLQKYLPHKDFTNYSHRLTLVMLSSNPNIVWCRCGTPYETECPKKLIVIDCMSKNCDLQFCQGCGESFKKDNHSRKMHDTLGCDDYHKKTYQDNVKWIETHAKKCPKCGIPVNRSRGCDTMRCTNCNKVFYYI